MKKFLEQKGDFTQDFSLKLYRKKGTEPTINSLQLLSSEESLVGLGKLVNSRQNPLIVLA